MVPDDARERLLAQTDADIAAGLSDEEDAHLIAGPDADAESGLARAWDGRIAVAFALLGAGMLWPFNAFITANAFFSTLFAQDALLLKHFSSSITFLFTLMNLASVLYTTITVKGGAAHHRIRISTLVLCVTLALLAVLSTFKIPPRVYFGLVLLAVSVCGCMIGVLQNGTFGIVGTYGSGYVTYIMIGQAIAGVTPAMLTLVVDAVSEKNSKKAVMQRAFSYFLSSSLILAAAHFAHLFLKSQSPSHAIAETPKAYDETGPVLADAKRLLRSSYPWTVFCVFAISLSVFPALTATVTSIHPGKRDLTVALGFVLWNTGDLLGRILSGTQTLCIRSGRTLLVLSVLRVVFVPLLFLCNIDGQGAHVQSDAFFFVYMLMFGTSNGYVASLCMSGAIDAAADQDKNTVGAVMSLMLCLGLLGGSLLSFLMH